MTNPADSLAGKDREKYEVFLAELYMKAITEFEPIVDAACSRMVSTQIEVNRAFSEISRFKNELVRLGELRDSKPGNPIEKLQEMTTMDDLIRREISESFVYFIEAGDFIKIGHSRDPIIRLGDVRKRAGMKIPDGLDTSRARILAVEQGTHTYESRLHRRFAEYRVAGEWFKKNDRLAHYIQSISSPA